MHHVGTNYFHALIYFRHICVNKIAMTQILKKKETMKQESFLENRRE